MKDKPLSEADALKLYNLYSEQIARCVELLSKFFKDDMEKVEAWMESDNPFLGNVSPMFLIIRGRGHKVIQFMESSLKENGADI